MLGNPRVARPRRRAVRLAAAARAAVNRMLAAAASTRNRFRAGRAMR